MPGKTAKVIASSKPEGDPWVFKAYQELYRRQPNACELHVKNYNNGTWLSYNELRNFVKEYQTAVNRQGLSVETADLGNNTMLVGFYLNGKQVAVNLVSANGGGVVAAGGANVVSAGGANVVSAGGANILVNSSMAGVNFSSGYRTLSQGSKIISTSGKGALVIH